jgi:hypothetical protein
LESRRFDASLLLPVFQEQTSPDITTTSEKWAKNRLRHFEAAGPEKLPRLDVLVLGLFKRQRWMRALTGVVAGQLRLLLT